MPDSPLNVLTELTTVPDSAEQYVVSAGVDFRASLANQHIGRTLSATVALGIRSSGAAFDLQIVSSEVLTANRALSIVLGNAARTLTIGASASVSGSNTGDQTPTSLGLVIGTNVLGAALADGKIYVGNGSGIGTAVTPSGDVTITNAGVTAIGALKVTNAMLAGAIADTKLSANIPLKNASNSFGGVSNAFTGYHTFGTNTIGAPSDTLTTGWRTLLYDGGVTTRAGLGVESFNVWMHGAPGIKFYTGPSNAGVLALTLTDTQTAIFAGAVLIRTPVANLISGDVLHLQGSDGATSLLTIDAYGTGVAPSLIGRQAGGTAASPTATLVDVTLFSVVGRGYQTTTGAFATSGNAAITFVAAEDFTATAQGASIIFGTTSIGSASRASRWKMADAGHFIALTDNTLDIGGSGATRPRTGFFGTSVVSPIFNATTGFQVGGAALAYGHLASPPIFETAFCVTVSTALAAGSLTGDIFRAYASATNNDDTAIEVPAGKTLKILAVDLKARTGAAAGTYLIKARLKNVTDTTYQDLVSITTTSVSTTVRNRAAGTQAAPIATLAGSKIWNLVILNDATSPGALDGTAGTGAQMAKITYIVE